MSLSSFLGRYRFYLALEMPKEIERGSGIKSIFQDWLCWVMDILDSQFSDLRTILIYVQLYYGRHLLCVKCVQEKFVFSTLSLEMPL